MSTFILALRYLRRDWRHPELRILSIALIIAVAAVSSVSFFTNRIEQVIARQAGELIGGDLVIAAYSPLPPNLRETAQAQGLKVAETWSFRSVILPQAQPILTEIKAVDAHYPLRGELKTALALNGAEQIAQQVPRGELWAEPRLLQQSDLKLGDKVRVGEAEFKLSKVLTYEPDRSNEIFQIAPRVLMNLDDVASTQLISVGSRVKYRLLITGEPNAIANYRAWIKSLKLTQLDVQGVEDSRPEIRSAVTRAQQFLGLAALISVLLAGAAIAVAAQHFAQRQANASAIMRCLGTTQSVVLQLYLWRILSIGILTSLIGCVLGWLAQQGIAALLAQYLQNLPALPPPDFSPWSVGMATGLITLLGFALPPILRISSVPPLRVLRHELGATPLRVWQVVIIAGLALSGLMLWQAGDFAMGWLMIRAVVGAVAVLLIAAYLLIKIVGKLRLGSQITWRFGLANLVRRSESSTLQLVAFGMGMMALLLLAVVRVDLLAAWQHQFTAGTPNQFLVNILPEQVSAVEKTLSAAGLKTSGMYPMVVGKFSSINGVELSADNYESERAKRFINRTFNFSSAGHLPLDNKIIEGNFDPSQPHQLSVEETFAKELRIKLGDVLLFRVGEREVKATVNSIRRVHWDSFNVNFFVLGSPDMTQDLPATYVSSFYLPPERANLLGDLVRQYSNVTPVDIGNVLNQVQAMMQQAVLAVEYVFMFTLLAGIMVLYAALNASHEERLYEGAILRTLGATRRQILSGLLAEFITLGALAGFLAASVANVVGYLIGVHLFDLNYSVNYWIWLLGIFGGGLGVGLAGLLGTRRILAVPPLLVLRGVG
ncbi:MAG: hypothetical protein RL368_775 [Pseudomonadota bacterium]|jgi:putative ABC transport system permease protein